jgi:type II secretory pathway pseudopilin PulG
MSRLRSQQGFALVAGILVITLISGLALSLIVLSNNGQKAALREQASETAFDVAEAALNAQVGQLARAWPSEKETKYESRCVEATSTEINGCPTSGVLNSSYPNTSSTTCQGQPPVDSWGSAVTNKWTTYVRDDVEGAGAPFNSVVEKSAEPWDANGDGKVWVRSVGLVDCRMIVLVTLVSRESVAVSFPHKVLIADWFETRNNGGHKGRGFIIDTKGESERPSNVSVRCGSVPSGKECAEYERNHEQVGPGEVVEEKGTSPAIPATVLPALRSEAEGSGTYYASGKCPNGLPTGKLVYVEGPCSIEGGANEVGNSLASPGYLIIVNGTLKMAGSSKFYGVVYDLDQQGSNNWVVRLEGSAELNGGIIIDGNGGASLSASGVNLVYNPKAFEELKAYAGVAGTRNSFRILSNSE